MFTIFRAILASFKGTWDEMDQGFRFLLVVEIAAWSLIAFTVLIWQPEFLTQ
jgi:hypothetical protein